MMAVSNSNSPHPITIIAHRGLHDTLPENSIVAFDAAMAAGFEDFNHHDAVADSEACAAIMIHAAERWGAIDLVELSRLASVRLSSTVPVVAAVAS